MSNNLNRIAVLSVHSSPLGQPGIGDTGGMSIYIRELSREMAKQGHTVDIYTRVQDPVTPEIIDLAPRARQIHILAGEPADIDKLLIYENAPDFACKTATYARQNGLVYDIIFSHYWISGIAGHYLQVWWKAPQMMMFHTLGAIKNAIGIGEDEPELRIEEERRIAQSSHRIIASTETEKIALYRFYDVPPEKVSVIPCGVNLDQFQPSDKTLARLKLGLNSDKIILFVGRIERLKGIDRIIQSLPYLSDIKPRLLIVGEDGNRPGEINRLKRLSVDLGVAEQVVFTGLIDYEKLPDYYNAADVCVFPSYYESFGLVPLESLACGTPVVATNVGNLKNIIRQGETGYIVEDSHPGRLAEKIGLILRERDPILKQPEEIRASVNEYNWSHIADSVIKEFDRLIAAEPVPTTE